MPDPDDYGRCASNRVCGGLHPALQETESELNKLQETTHVSSLSHSAWLAGRQPVDTAQAMWGQWQRRL
ncbi:hypothetical protein TNCV_203091 [Trichonephila clavipes]|nr:hypothetical protein TNCV_203091 [Trichonephila clavipes]